MIKLNELVYLNAQWIRFIANFMYVSICTCTNKKKLHKKSRTKSFVRSVCKVIAKICQRRLIYFMKSDSFYVRYFLFISWEKLISKNIMHSHNQPIEKKKERTKGLKRETRAQILKVNSWHCQINIIIIKKTDYFVFFFKKKRSKCHMSSHF